jgi:hypothetical protein
MAIILDRTFAKKLVWIDSPWEYIGEETRLMLYNMVVMFP